MVIYIRSFGISSSSYSSLSRSLFLPSFFLSKAAFLTQTVTLDDATVKFEIWDTAGEFCS